MLALSGCLTITAFLALVLTGRATPLVALIAIPLLSAVLTGHAADIGGYVTAGLQQTAGVAATFVFAIIHFGVVADAGLLDPVVERVLRMVGADPVKIALGTTLLATLAQLDGSGAVTFLLVIPVMLPLYERLGMDRRVLACVVAMAAGVMNMLPWGGPLLRAAASLHVSVSGLFVPLAAPTAVGLVFAFFAAWWLGRREAIRLGHRGGDGAPAVPTRILDAGMTALRRPRLIWFNAVLTLAMLALMVAEILSPRSPSWPAPSLRWRSTIRIPPISAPASMRTRKPRS